MDQFRDDVHRKRATPPNPRQAVEARRHEIDNLVQDIARHQEAAELRRRQGREDLAAEEHEQAAHGRELLRAARAELARDLAAADDTTGEP